jgi:hypothetical protein
MTSSQKQSFTNSIKRLSKKHNVVTFSGGWEFNYLHVRTLPEFNKIHDMEVYNSKMDVLVEELKNLPDVSYVHYGVDRWNVYRFLTITVGSSNLITYL